MCMFKFKGGAPFFTKTSVNVVAERLKKSVTSMSANIVKANIQLKKLKITLKKSISFLMN